MQNRQLQPPNRHKGPLSVFLAGSIEMGTARNWQEELIGRVGFYNLDVLFLNPRRDDWDSTWEQSIENKYFRDQVEWELDMMDSCDLIVMHFEPDTQSPITLLEFGMYTIAAPKKLVVSCPNGYWRKGNVDVVCARHSIKTVDGIDGLYDAIWSAA